MDTSKTKPLDDVVELSNKFTALNNELLNAKRELVKQNIELERLRTELQDKNEALAGMNTELEKRVEERTRLLSLAIDEIDDFAYSLSHDLRTPLRGIDGFSAVLIDDYKDRLDAQAIKHLNGIRKDAQHLGVVLDALHSLTKVSRRPLQRTMVNLSDMAESIMQNLLNKHTEIKPEYHIQQGMIENCDRDLVMLVLGNLLSNAIKFSQNVEKPTIDFGIRSKDKRKTYFVRDNGVGFNMDYAAKLFQNFQRLHSNNEFEGIGIGLAMVRRVVSKHGGSIWVESEVGKGTEFQFSLEP